MEKLIYTIPKNTVEEIRVIKKEFKGDEYIDFRVYYNSPTDGYIPTKKGICISVDNIDEIEKALKEIKKVLREP